MCFKRFENNEFGYKEGKSVRQFAELLGPEVNVE